ncbi:MAG TPA: TMEM175 family protein [Candidatus Dormibacteraeota bacterium]|nr:TMEM175 family protein [Candidatus Dormibacteraeota bacterium]
MSKGRVEAFSDGVFAVAATLLIFNIQIDKTAPGGLLAALLAAWPKYAAYVASFLTIGVMWMNHHGLFERIARLDRALLLINLLLLMAIVFIPFSTAELGANILVPRDANTAASLYAINAFVIAIFFGAVWSYALLHPNLLTPDVDRRAALRAWPRFSVGSVVYLACVPLGQLSPIAVVFVCAALAVYYVFERLPDITHQPAAGARRQP